MILEGLNPEQVRAVEAVRGPVCILAGAGSGKTTTVTRRIANQVRCGAFRAEQILAVTFTDRAAGELRARLEALGTPGVRASTFHAAAFAQLRRFRGEAPGRLLASKALLLRQVGNTLPKPYRFRPAADLATEIEWAKNRRLTPESYPHELGQHEPPIPADLIVRVFREYERRKATSGLLDFEDLLGLTVRVLEDDPGALARVHERYRAFTVDEYQDLNLLQQTLLELWLGERDELCAVGDDYQSIYAFTGATPEYLLALPRRYPQATLVRLEANYRSSPEVLALANRLVPKLGGASKTLRAVRTHGPEPELQGFADAKEEGGFVVERIRALHGAGLPLEDLALLMRLNARSADFEELLTAASIPFQGSALLQREAARQLLRMLRPGERPVGEAVRALALGLGWNAEAARAESLGERELTRQADLARLVALAREFEDEDGETSEFHEWLRARFDRGGGGGGGGGVHLLTLHRAKGLEWEAVFLPRLEEGELPCKAALRNRDQIAEERRLLYVGLTRARRHLALTWTKRPSRFLAELGVATASSARQRGAGEALPAAFAPLREWRLRRAQADQVPAYLIFHNATLEQIAARAPQSLAELATVPGVGPTKLERYGEEVLAELARAS